MSPGLLVACSFALTHGVAVALAWRELRKLRPNPRGRPGGNALPPRPAPLRPFGQKPLPDCLIPKKQPAARPVRVRELA